MLLQNQKTNFSALLIDIVFLAAPECTTVRIEERCLRVDQGQKSDQLINGARGDHMNKKLFEVLILQTGVDQKLFWKLVFVAKKTNIEFK